MNIRLELAHVTARYARTSVVDDVSFHLEPGATLAVVGPNAAGKSSLLKAIAGALPLVAGTVRIGNQPLSQLSPKDRAARLAFVPQSSRFDLDFTVREVVSFGRAAHAGPWGLLRKHDDALVDRALERTELRSLAHRPFSDLSGGERQRVLLARAIAQQAAILLLDEPTAHLDLKHQLLVIDTVLEHARRGGVALVALHDLALAARLGAVAVIDKGALVAFGLPDETLTSERLAKTWGVSGRIERTEDGPTLRVTGRAAFGS